MKDSYDRIDKLYYKDETDKFESFINSLKDSITEFTITIFKDEKHKISSYFQLLGDTIISHPIAQIESQEIKEKYISNSRVLIMHMAVDDQTFASNVQD
jgi:hypothetical protein